MIFFRFIILGFWIALSGSLAAQKIDSLQHVLNATTTSSERIPLLKQLGEACLSKRDTLAIRYFEELVELSQFADDPVLKAYSYYRMGVSNYQFDKAKKSSDLYFKGLEATTESVQFDEIKAKLYNAIGWNFNLLGKHDVSLKYYTKAEHYSKSINNAQLKALILNNKGVTYKDLKNYDSAFLSFEQSLAVNKKINNQRQVRFNLNNIGTVLFELKRFAEAKTYFAEVLSLNVKAQDTVEIINNLLNLSNVNVQIKSIPEANEQLNEALSLAVKSNSLEQQRRIYNSLKDVALKSKNYEDALRYQNEFYTLTDSLYRKESIEKVLEIEAKFSDLMKDRDLQKARQEVSQRELYLVLIIGVLLITLVVIFFLWRLIRIRRANEFELIKLNHEIEAQAQKLKLSNAEISTINDHLEELVKDRTAIIHSQNKRLLEFAYMNSHKIRGPLASLLGLLNLLHMENAPENNKELICHLKTTATKMDEIIHEVSRELEREDQL